MCRLTRDTFAVCRQHEANRRKIHILYLESTARLSQVPKMKQLCDLSLEILNTKGANIDPVCWNSYQMTQLSLKRSSCSRYLFLCFSAANLKQTHLVALEVKRGSDIKDTTLEFKGHMLLRDQNNPEKGLLGKAELLNWTPLPLPTSRSRPLLLLIDNNMCPIVCTLSGPAHTGDTRPSPTLQVLPSPLPGLHRTLASCQHSRRLQEHGHTERNVKVVFSEVRPNCGRFTRLLLLVAPSDGKTGIRIARLTIG